ncbi:dinitrogenase iron-molybdenum cofactor [Ruminiclostridium hungatei]|uniref:Dinitrogenase iron-molybdenum cofactor n=1 Tax=Ruminiclostridium hungatei TaxID=48256 RepID=A0A1V4SGZ1_RUMHU|nr:NifB/NifX family molybdenum-iron cluster-binding protein [Ruminiclostridium hungatei]OPX42511.1 dinitrogenase iron-molybdenum cofactor [Ruminiclostridium hungatei]
MSQRIAIASSDGKNIDLHFARATSFYIYEIDQKAFKFIEIRKPSAANSHDESEFARTLKLIEDCSSIIVNRIGRGALAFIQAKGIRIFEASYPIDVVLKKLIDKKIIQEG